MKIKTIIIGILLIAITLGITYAWWTWTNTNNTNVSFTINGAIVTYNGGNNIRGINLIPVSTKEVGVTNNTAVYKEITASANKTMYLTLNLTLTTFPSNLAHQSLLWEVYKGNNKISEGNFSGKSQGNTITLFEDNEINTTSSLYKLYIWIDGNQTNPSTMMNQSFSFTLNATATDKTPSALPDFIKNSNAPLDNVNSTYVQNQSPGIDFTSIASDTNGKGLYIRSGTENDINPIYYYRGAVNNNNVVFAHYCWKIVRTTETGGLKMIYNGTPTNGSCGNGTTSQNSSTIGNSAFNTNYDNAKFVGYTYDNNDVETDSTIKTAIDSWYQTNLLTNYDSYIEDTVYCNDREEAILEELTAMNYSNREIAYKPAVRHYITDIPNLECTNNADKYTKSNTIGNGKLTYPIGLLTMDEIWLAGEGSSRSSENNTYYLYNSSYWWTLSPFDYSEGDAHNCYTVPSMGLFRAIVSGSCGVRPVISLKPEYNTFDFGNGTGDNPYGFLSGDS